MQWLGKQIVDSTAINPFDVVRLLAFFDAPANILSRTLLTNYVETNAVQIRASAKAVAENNMPEAAMRPLLGPIKAHATINPTWLREAALPISRLPNSSIN